MRLTKTVSLVALTLCLGVPSAFAAGPEPAPFQLAQIFNRPTPPADLDDDQPAPRGPDTGALVVRMDQLQSQIRSLTGQIEELQFKVRKLEEQARAGLESGGRAAAAQPVVVPPIGAPVTVGAPSSSPVAVEPRLRRGDAFNPAADPNAPGAPRPLGATAPSGPLSSTPPTVPAARPVANAPMQPMDLGQPRPPATPLETSPGGTVIATAQPPGPKEEYDLAAAFLKQGQYDQAEKGFSTFLGKNPKSRYAPDAIFGLGESYFQRGRHREAAEQYLKISTAHPNAAKGAEALLRLGESLNALGAKEQACASFAEIGRKYPNASTTIRAGEREAKKISC